MSTQEDKREQKIAQNILQQIQSGKVTMRPRWQFTLLAALGVIGLAAASIITVYLVNLVAFKLRLASANHPMYGIQTNLDYFAGNFPWLAFVLGLASFGLLIWLARKHDFSYRLGRWLFVAIVLLSLGIGTTLAFTSLNNHLENFGPTRGIYGEQLRGSQGPHTQNNGKAPAPSPQGGNSTMQRLGQQN